MLLKQQKAASPPLGKRTFHWELYRGFLKSGGKILEFKPKTSFFQKYLDRLYTTP
jgi:uncharacterized caspase-like protein